MSLKENVAMLFTDEHQPSKISKVAATSAKSSQGIPATIQLASRGKGRGMRGRHRAITPPVNFFL
jgi:hypothetical protein